MVVRSAAMSSAFGKHVRPEFRVKETGANLRAAGAPEEEILADRPDKGAFNLRGH